MPKDYSTQTDLKKRWGGLLEHPYVSKAQRHSLDGFKVTQLKKALTSFEFDNILDICCGLGEYSTMNKGKYYGLDNSTRFLNFAHNRYKQHRFVFADALRLPFKDRSFEAVLQAGSSHHFRDEEFDRILTEMKRVSRRYIIVADIVWSDDQGRLSRYLYNCDRGTNIRRIRDFEQIFETWSGYNIVLRKTHKTFPGLYTHAVFVLESKA